MSKQDEFKITPEIEREIIRIVDARLLETQIIRKDLFELKSIVKELAEAQKNSEQRLGRVEAALEELAQAQKRTEQRVEELADAQKRTEQRVEELAQAQKRTEQRVEELADAQKRTEEELKALIADHRETRSQLGGLSATVGYRLEDEAFKALPELLKRDYGMVIQERLKRQFLKDKTGQPVEVNIIGEALKNGKKITVIGEGKSQLSKKGVNEFIRKKLARLEGMFDEIFPVLVTYMISEPDVEEYVKEKGIALYYSYDF